MLGLGSASTLGIGLAVYLDDQFSQGSRRISQALSNIGMEADKFQRNLGNLEEFGAGLAAIGDRAYGVARKGITEFAKFDKTMTAVSVVGEIDKKSAAYQKLMDQTMDLSAKYGQMPDDIAKAQLELAKAGKSVPEIMKLSQAVITLGAATDTLVGGRNGAAEMLVNVMQAFNAGVDQSSYYADILTSAANRSTIDVVDFYESLKYSSDVAQSLHIPIDKVAASIATLGNAGLKGSMAGTSYANMLRYISTGVTDFGTKRQQQALKNLGLTAEDFKDAKGNVKDLGQILAMLRKETAGMSDPDRLGILTALTGVRGNRALDILMRGMTEDAAGNKIQTYDAMFAAINADAKKGVAELTATLRMDTMSGDQARFTAMWNRFYIAIGKSFEPIVRPLLQITTKVMGMIVDLSESPVGAWFIRMGLIFGMVLGPLGRVMSLGARFLGWMTTSTGVFSGGMKTGKIAALEIKTILLSASQGFVANMLKARGLSTMAGRGGTTMMRGPSRIMGKSNWLVKGLGAIFGVKGARWGIQAGRFFTKLAGGSGIISKLFRWFIVGGGWLKSLGSILGRVVAGFLGWPVMLADLGLTMLTGRGIFERLWEGLKWLYDKIVNFGDWFTPGEWFSGLGSALFGTHNATAPITDPYTVPGHVGNTYSNVMNSSSNSPIKLNVSVHPITGDKKTEHSFNLNGERDLTGQGFKIYS